MSRATEDDAAVSVVPATEQDEPVIANLLQLMLHDLSPFFGEWIGDDGRYAYAWLETYWRDQDRHPYLIRRPRHLTGFALVMPHSPITGITPCWFMAEFFVLKAQRRRGFGQAALRQILSRHRGDWEIAVMQDNRDAVPFWSHALAQLHPAELQHARRVHDKHDWIVHSFTV